MQKFHLFRRLEKVITKSTSNGLNIDSLVGSSKAEVHHSEGPRDPTFHVTDTREFEPLLGDPGNPARCSICAQPLLSDLQHQTLHIFSASQTAFKHSQIK